MTQRESFVFHEDFVCDLPDAYKADFMRFTIEYGLYGTLPPITEGTLEMALWAKIARRIDAESEKYKEVSAKRKEAARKRYQQYQQMGKPPKKETPEPEKTAERAEKKNTGQEPAEIKKEEAPKKTAAFVRPTPEEIRTYCTERKNGIDAQTFFDFYESKGWKIGNVKMKDWRASVRTWEQRRTTEQTGGRNKAGAIWGNENEIPEDYFNLL